MIFGPNTAHAGRGVGQTSATDAVTETLTRCRASQRRFRNTLVFVAPDELQLAAAREVTRRAMAWVSILKDTQLRKEMTQGQVDDATEKAKTNTEGAQKAVRGAWSHIFYPVRSDTAGKPFELEHSFISARDRAVIPVVVYDKGKADGVLQERLGAERLWIALRPIWPEDRPHLPLTEIADWFASYVYLPRLRDRVVLETTIRDAVAKLDPEFGYADSFDEATGRYLNLVWAKNPPELPPATAVLVRAAEARGQHADSRPKAPGEPSGGGPGPVEPGGKPNGGTDPRDPSVTPAAQRKPRRFYGSVEIDMVRPMKSFDAIFNAVVMELQRTNGAKIKLTLEIEGEAPEGFAGGEVSVVQDNAKQLKFKSESTGFEE